MKQVIAVLCSDIHFSQSPPIARSSEPDWFAAMARPITEMRKLAGHAPLIVAGDIFDKWNSSAELINFAIDQFSQFRGVYTIPGQHDLPAHNYDEMRRSSYGTLIRTKAVTNLSPGEGFLVGDNLIVYGFPWGFPLTPCPVQTQKSLANCHTIAAVHAYVWKTGFSYPGAPEEKMASSVFSSADGYDVAVFGDNHKGFVYKNILNSGGLMRRKIDEIESTPSVGLFYSDGTWERHFLDCSEDVFISQEKYKEIDEDLLNFEQYIDDLRQIGVATMDFRQEIKHRMERTKTSPEVQKVVLDVIEGN